MARPYPDPVTVNNILNNNLVDQFSLLRGVPGICLDPLPWDKINDLVAIDTVQSLGTLGRHPAGIVEYRKFRKQVQPYPPRMMALAECQAIWIKLCLNLETKQLIRAISSENLVKYPQLNASCLQKISLSCVDSERI